METLPRLYLTLFDFSSSSSLYQRLLRSPWTFSIDSKFIQIQSRQTSQKPVSVYLSPEMKTYISYDCIPTFSNILVASIVDIDENQVVKSFGIKKGIELKIEVM